MGQGNGSWDFIQCNPQLALYNLELVPAIDAGLIGSGPFTSSENSLLGLRLKGREMANLLFVRAYRNRPGLTSWRLSLSMPHPR